MCVYIYVKCGEKKIQTHQLKGKRSNQSGIKCNVGGLITEVDVEQGQLRNIEMGPVCSSAAFELRVKVVMRQTLLLLC